jgi:hypothetical protein
MVTIVHCRIVHADPEQVRTKKGKEENKKTRNRREEWEEGGGEKGVKEK